MADDDETLAHVGHAIYTQLEKITALAPPLTTESTAFKTWNSIINECDRFKIWSTSTGLLIPGHGSLDYRVREADTLAITFRSFLLDLRENFEEVLTFHLPNDPLLQPENGSIRDNTESDNDGDDDDVLDILLESITDVLDRLFRLATKLRNPETRLRSSRAQKFEKSEDGVDLFKCFYKYDLDFVSSTFPHYRRGPTMVSDDQRTASLDADLKIQHDDDSSSYLTERLALANIARRRQFAYWEHHRLKLDKHTETAIAARKASDLLKIKSNLPTPINLQTRNPEYAMTISTATQLLRPIQDFDDLASIVSASEYLPTSAGESGDLVTFPPVPHVATDAKFFECPYCFTTCNKKALRTKAWQAHLVHDLRPYICTYRHCRTANQLYDTKADWIQHENANHATKWTCPLHPDEVFDDFLAFRMHTNDEHVQCTMIERDLQGPVGADPTTSETSSCPICSVSGLPTPRLYDHIATHLERLAMFSLPKHVGWSENDDNSRDSNEAYGEHDSGIFEGESILSFASVPASIRSEASLPEKRADPQLLPVLDGLGEKEGEVDAVEKEQSLKRDLLENEQKLGPYHISTLSTLQKLGDLYIEQDRVDEAEENLDRALAGRRRIQESDHKSIRDITRSLGNVYWYQGKSEQAEEMYMRSLSEEEKPPELEHDFFVSIWGDIAHLHKWQGKYSHAAQAYQQILDLQTKLLGRDDPHTIASIHNLAVTLTSAHRFEQARQLFQETIDLQKKVLGIDNHDTLLSMHELAGVLRLEEKLGEAEQLYREIIQISQRKSQLDPIITASSMTRLAEILELEGKLEEEEQIREELYEFQRGKGGWEFETKIVNMEALARLLLIKGKLHRAEVLYREALHVRQSRVGLNDGKAAETTKALAHVLRLQGKHNEVNELDPQAPSTNSPVISQAMNTSTPLEKLEALRYHFYTTLEPQIEYLLRFPPPNEEDRARESRRFSKLIYQEVFEKGDAIESEAPEDDATRTLRERLYVDANEYLAGLKAVLRDQTTTQESAGAETTDSTTNQSMPSSYLVVRIRLRSRRMRMVIAPDIDFNTLHSQIAAKFSNGSSALQGHLDIFYQDKDDQSSAIYNDKTLSEALRHWQGTSEHSKDADFVMRLNYN